MGKITVHSGDLVNNTVNLHSSGGVIVGTNACTVGLPGHSFDFVTAVDVEWTVVENGGLTSAIIDLWEVAVDVDRTPIDMRALTGEEVEHVTCLKLPWDH